MAIASVLAGLRKNFGQIITWQGKPYAAIVDVVPKREMADIPEAAGLNAANANARYVSLTPADFIVQGKPVYPQEDQSIALDEGRGPEAYTILSAPVQIIQGQPVKVRLLVYRTPATDSATEATETEQRAEDAANGTPDAPGAVVTTKRKSYSPGPSNL